MEHGCQLKKRHTEKAAYQKKKYWSSKISELFGADEKIKKNKKKGNEWRPSSFLFLLFEKEKNWGNTFNARSINEKKSNDYLQIRVRDYKFYIFTGI